MPYLQCVQVYFQSGYFSASVILPSWVRLTKYIHLLDTNSEPQASTLDHKVVINNMLETRKEHSEKGLWVCFPLGVISVQYHWIEI